MNTDDTLAYLRMLRPMKSIVMPILEDSAGGMTDDELAVRMDGARRATDDLITDQVAVYLACTMISALGVGVQCCGTHGFSISTLDGRPVDVEDARPGPVARARMVTAIANSDVLAARDVFVAYAKTRDRDAVTRFLVDFVVEIVGVARRRGMVIRA